MLKIFDDDSNQIGTATRHDVHRVGYWHEVFHCWFVSRHKNEYYIYLQLRSPHKDYPNLLDITAAGHLLADETVQDGVREIQEEVGVNVSFNELVPLGTVKYRIIENNFFDKEIANVFLYQSHHNLEDFNLQVNEVTGIVKCKFSHFHDLWFGKRRYINIKGYMYNENGKKTPIDKKVGHESFVPHEVDLYQTVLQKIKKYLIKEN